MNSRILRIALAAVAALGLAGVVAWWQIEHAAIIATPQAPAIGGPFRLTDQTGHVVADTDFRGEFLLVYFGYTFCPDVCPTELAAMARAVDKLGPLGEKVRPLFITIDPARDTPAHLADYVQLFHPRLLGLTGTPDEIKAVAKAYRVYYARAKSEGAKSEEAKSEGANAEGSEKDYLMDHSSFVYLMGPDGRFLTVFAAGTAGERMAEDIAKRFKP